jgi:glycosyltransferase involved in cell wall biosynthesis
VVASRVGGLPDLVPDGTAGLLVPPRDEIALAAALERVLGDAPLAARLGEGARVQARRYSAQVVVDRIEDAYAQTIADVAARTLEGAAA